MRLSLVFACVVIAACSSPDIATRALFSVTPDTLVFEGVRAGTTMDRTAEVKNLTDDTLWTVQSNFSDSSFFVIVFDRGPLPPHATRKLVLRYASHDTGTVNAVDSITIQGSRVRLALRSRATPFSTVFLRAPRSLSVSLTGIIGTEDSSSIFAFSFFAPFFSSGSPDSLRFYTSRLDVLDRSIGGEPLETQSSSEDISAYLDSTLRISYINAYSSLTHSQLFRPGSQSKLLKLRGVQLHDDGATYSATVAMTDLPSHVDSVNFWCQGEFQSTGCPDWTGFFGYRSDAVLNVVITK